MTLRISLATLLLALLALTGRADDAVRHTFTYTLAQAGQVSAGIYDQAGVLQRTLLAGELQEAGEHRLVWDGLDRWGKPVPPGSYTWRLLRTPGFQATYVTTVGSNAAGAPWQVWVGNHASVTAVAVVGDDMYVGSACAENTPVLIKQSLDNTRHHWAHRQFEAWVGPVSIAVLKDRVYFLQPNAKIQIAGTELHERGRYEAAIPSSQKLGTWNLLWPGDEANRGYGPKMDMDAWDDAVAVTWLDHHTLRWLDPASGETIAEAKVDQPRALALGPAGTAYVISNNRIVRIPREGGEPVEIVPATQLTEPRHIALDRAAGELLVAEAAPSHRVKRFDLTGRLLQIYGRDGGRAYGPYIAADFLNINAIAADERGGFLLAEGHTTLGRTVHIARDGSVHRSWYGPQQFFNFTTPDPANPNHLIFQGGYGDKTVAEIDPDTRAWRVIANYAHHDFGGFFPSPNHYSVQWQARRRDGHLYLVSGAAIIRVDEQAGKLVPVAVAGRIDANKQPEGWAAIAAHHGHDDPARAPLAFTWSDRNGDGEFQPEEFTLGGNAAGRVAFLDEDWNVTFGNANPRAHDGAAWLTMPNRADDGARVPLWDWQDLAPGPGQLPPSFLDLGGAEPRDLHRDADGNVYLFVAANRGPGDDRHGEGWPTNRSGSSRLVKWQANGELAWVAGRHALRNPHHVQERVPPGRFHDPARLIGIVNDSIIYADRVRHPAAAFSTDGLYAGSFFDRRADDGLPSHLYAWWRDADTRHPDTPVPYDCLTGGSILQLDDDTVLWTPMGESNTPVYRVSGWQGWERQEGTLSVAQAAPAASGGGTGLTAHYFDNPQLAGEPVVQRLDARIWFEQRRQRQVYAAWDQGPAPDVIKPESFSARWTGQVEARLSEEHVFSVYSNAHARVRLWLDGDLILEYWPAEKEARDPRPRVTWDKLSETASKPIALRAGARYQLTLEYANEEEKPILSFNWDSFTQERQRIPTAHLTPTTPAQP